MLFQISPLFIRWNVKAFRADALAARWPGRIGAGRVVEDFVNLMDLGPTFCEAGGIAAPESMTAKSLVPLLNFAAEYYPAEKWRIVGELDGLASPQGRAFDVSLKGYYDVADWCSLGLGYRTIEGGVDNDDVYNFAWFNTVFASVSYRF